MIFHDIIVEDLSDLSIGTIYIGTICQPMTKVLEELVMSERIIKGMELEAAMTVVDSKSVKNALRAWEKGYDGGGKNIGSKIASGSRHIGAA